MTKLAENNQQGAANIADDRVLATVLLCDCGSAEHQIIIHKDKDFSEGYREVILCPHLITYRNIFKRVLVAFKYIFGYKCRYGQWDEFILKPEHANQLRELSELLSQHSR